MPFNTELASQTAWSLPVPRSFPRWWGVECLYSGQEAIAWGLGRGQADLIRIQRLVLSVFKLREDNKETIKRVPKY